MTYLWRRLQTSFSTHQLRYFFLVLSLFALSEGMLIFYIPIKAEAELGGLLSVGLILAIGNIAGIVTDLIFGFVSEITDHRKFMHIAGGLSFLILPLLLIESSWASLIMLGILWGARFEIMVSFATNIYLAKHAPPGKFFEVSGTSFLLRNLGYFGGAVLANHLRLESPFLVAAVLLVIFLVEMLFMYVTFDRHPEHEFKHKAHKLTLYSEIAILRKHFRQVLPFFVLSFGVATFEAMFLIFGPPTFAKLAPELAGLLTTIGLLANVLVPTIAVRLIEWAGTGLSLAFSALGVSLMSLLIINTSAVEFLLPVIFLAFVFLVFVFVTNDGSFLHTISKLKKTEEDEVISVRSMGPNLAYVTTALLGGVVVSRYGFQAGVLLGTILLLLSLIIFTLTRERGSAGITHQMYK